ncbi:hypothetical protein GCM10009784_22180 [Arthrobacter parietis]|uniref:AAA domain-containing protein n=1 Tax=Arthrobacter parietis TaxID=271434 RepID=A0ABP5MS57_9MICC
MAPGGKIVRRPVLILFCGLPESGKTTAGCERERETGAIRFSTDEWMADLGVDYFDGLRDGLQLRLNRLWKELLERGQSVILEDGTWKRGGWKTKVKIDSGWNGLKVIFQASRDCLIYGVSGGLFSSFSCRESVAESDAKAFKAGFQRTAHRVLPAPVGSRDRVTRWRHFSAACSVGK